MTTAFGTGVTGPDGRSLDQVQLTGVSARGYHGVLPSERQAGQEFRADVVLYLDTRPAAAGDDLAQTVSYADVAQDVHDVLAGEPVDLVETVAERIAAAVLARPQVEAVDVRVHKPQAPIPVPFADVEVAIRRDRSRMPVVPAPASSGSSVDALGTGPGSGAVALGQAQEPTVESLGYEPQDVEPIGRPASDEPAPFEREPYQPGPHLQEPTESAQLRAEPFEPDPLVDRVPASVASAAQPVADLPEPRPVPELIAPEPLQVIPAAWNLQPDATEQRDQLGQEPAFRPDEQFLPEQAFEPVEQYESVQGLDQRPDQPNVFEQQPFEQQQYDQLAQRQEQTQPEQPAQQFAQQGQFDRAQQFDQTQPGYEQPGYERPAYGQPTYEQPGYEQQRQFEQQQQLDPQQNQYDQLFEQQGDAESPQGTAAAAPDPAVGQPEQFQAEQFQPEPRDRFDEVPAGHVDVVIAIGANLGDPQATMRSAVAELDRMPGLQITDVSPLARTAAVGGPEEQPDYLNAVLLARTTLSARGLLHLCQEVENVHGRTREEHWGPRTLDVDLIAYGNLTDAAEDLEVPHPRAHERAFVLEPWSQIAPDAVLPGLGGGPVAQLAATAPDRAGIRWLALDWLTDPEPEQGGGATAPNHPAVSDDGGNPGQDPHGGGPPPALPPSLPPSGRPQASPGGPVVEVPGGGHPQGQHSGQVELDRPAQGGAPQQDAFPGGPHPQGYPSGPVPGAGGSVPSPQQAPLPSRGAPAGVMGNGSAVPPPEEALVPAPQPPIAPRAVRDTAHEEPAHEPLPPASSAAKPVFAPVNPSRQQSGVFPPVNGNSAAPQEPAAPVFAPVGAAPDSVSDQAPNGQPNGHPNGQPDGQQVPYDNDHTVIRVPGFVGDQRTPPPSDGPIDSVPSWVPVRDERGRDV